MRTERWFDYYCPFNIHLSYIQSCIPHLHLCVYLPHLVNDLSSTPFLTKKAIRKQPPYWGRSLPRHLHVFTPVSRFSSCLSSIIPGIKNISHRETYIRDSIGFRRISKTESVYPEIAGTEGAELSLATAHSRIAPCLPPVPLHRTSLLHLLHPHRQPRITTVTTTTFRVNRHSTETCVSHRAPYHHDHTNTWR